MDSINSIGSNYNIATLNPTQVSTAQASSTSATTDSTQLSPMASLLSQLKQLQQTDPDKFQKVMENISDTLKSDAASAPAGSKKQAFLTDLAAKFDDAAKNNTMPDLQPKGQQQGTTAHHHHGGHHAKSYSGTSESGASGPSQGPIDLAQIIQAALQTNT
jgi:hypothetical protein